MADLHHDAGTYIEGPDPSGRYAVVCLCHGDVLTIAESREEAYADL